MRFRLFVLFIIAVLASQAFLFLNPRFAQAESVAVNCSGTSGSPTAVTEADLAGDDVTFFDAGGSGYCAIDEAISAASIIVGAGVVLTHPDEDASGITITTTGNMTVTGDIDVSGKGCQGVANSDGYGPNGSNVCTLATSGYGDGNGTFTGGEGGGYGGVGGAGTLSAGGNAYGSPTAPVLQGSSGGGSSAVAGGDGGGYINLNVGGILTLDGSVTANGSNGTAGSNQSSGGGSGGAINITAVTIDGAGSISVNGGNGATSGGFDSGSGGGGRIAISYSDTAGSDFSFSSTSLSSSAGTETGTGQAGSKGTVYVIDTTASAVQIFHGFDFDSTDYSVTTWTADSSATNQYCTSSAASPSITASGTLTLNGTLTCASSSLTSFNLGAGTLSLASGMTINLASSSNGADMDINITGGGSTTWTNATISLPLEGILTINDAVTLTLAGTTAITANVQFTNLTAFTLGASTSINANTLGCRGVANSDGYGPTGSNVCTVTTAGYGDGNGTFTGGEGGGHGGAGGAGTLSAGGNTYDSQTAPVLLGSSGGGSSSNRGGHGGGLIQVQAVTLTNSGGTLSANGGDGLNGGSNQSSGGGSGGSIYLSATGTLTMESGAVTTTGGAGKINAGFNSGSGGGGRVRIDYATAGSGTTTYLGTLAAATVAAKGTGGANNGVDGTLSTQLLLAFSSATTSVSSGTSVDTLTVVFNQAVTITDASGVDGLDVITLSDGNCTINNGTYAESGAGNDTLVLNITCTGASQNNTGITINVTYTTAGSSTIVDDATLAEMTNGSTITGVDGAAPVLLISVTGNLQTTSVTRLAITFSEQVDIVDSGAGGDGFDAITLENETSGTCAISDSDYSNSDVTSLTLTVSCSASNNTALLFDPQYATAGASTIKDNATLEMANAETATSTDGAEPYPISITYKDVVSVNGTVDRVDVVFSESLNAGVFSYSASDWSFPEDSELNLSDSDATLGTTTSANDTVLLTVSADTKETGHTTTPTLLYTNNAANVRDAAANQQTETFNSGINVTDGAAPAINTATFYDASSSDGKLDIITVVFTENIATAANASADWAISSAANFAALSEGTVECNSGSAGANECDYNFTTTTIKTNVGDLTLAYTAGTSLNDGNGNNTGSLSITSATSPAFTDGAAPAAIDSLISIAGGTGTGGAYKVGNTITVTWNNSSTAGDVNSVKADLSGWGGSATATMTDTTACGGTNGNYVYEACYTITGAEAIDTTGVNTSVDATDSTSNNRVGSDTTGATVDTIVPTLTASKLTITGCSGTGGACKNGNTPTLTWDDTAATGDNNTDTISSVSFNGASLKAGDIVLVGSNSSDTWTASLSGALDSQDDTGNTISATVTDNAGNSTGPTSSSTSYTVDTVAPVVTAGSLTATGATGTGGAFKLNNTQTYIWNPTTSGETDTISSVSFNGSSFKSGDTSVAGSLDTNWTATSSLDSQDDTGNTITATVTDNAGNSTTSASSTASYTIDTIAPTATNTYITVTGCNGTGGACKNGNTAIARWDNSATGDNNTDTIASATFNAASFDDESTALAGSVAENIYTSTIGALDSQDDTGNTITLIVIDNAGNSTGSVTSSTSYTIDTIVPTLTAAKLTITGCSGTGGACKNGNTPTLTWDDTAATGDNNTDTISSVSFNGASLKAGDTALVGSNSSDTWTASLSGALDSQDDTGNTIAATVTDNAGNSTGPTSSSTSYTVDTVVPVVTAGSLTATGATGTGGAFKLNNTQTYIWNPTTSGETDTISSVSFNGSSFKSGDTSVAGSLDTNWTATSSLDSQDDTGNTISATVVDNAGNSTTSAASTASYTIDTIAPTVTNTYITVTGATGTGGAFKNGNTAVARWDNSATGDNNTDTIASATFNAASFDDESTALAGSVAENIYTSTIGALDSQDDTGNTITLIVIDNAGNSTGSVTSSTSYTIDTIVPTLTAAKLTITGCSGTGGACKNGNTPTLTWDDTAATGDNNTDTISSVSFNGASLKAGDTALVGSNSSDTWTASLSGALDSQDDTGNTITLIVIDNAGNSTGSVTSSTSYTVDTVVPTVTQASITVTGAMGTSGAFKNGDLQIYTWNPTTSGETDTISSVSFNGSSFKSGDTSVAGSLDTNWTATSSLDSQDDTGNTITVIVIDNAGNSTGPTTSSTSYTIDTILPAYSSSSYTDANSNGVVDRVDVVFSEDVSNGFVSDIEDWLFPAAGTVALVTPVLDASIIVDADTVSITPSSSASNKTGGTAPTLTYAHAGGTLKDDAGNSVSNFSVQTISDSAAPVIYSRVYLDAGLNGSADMVNLYLTENVSYNGNDLNQFVVVENDLAIGTVPLARYVSADELSLNMMEVADKTGVSGGTEPTIRYVQSGTVGNRVVDGSGNYLATEVSASSISDGANPLILSYSYSDNGGDGTVDRLTVTFTEAVTHNGSDLTQFAITANSLTSFSSVSSLSSGSGTATIVYVTSATTDLTGVSGGTEPTIVFTGTSTTPNKIKDSSNNATRNKTSISVSDLAAPRIKASSGRYTLDNNADGIADYVKLVMTEKVTDSSVAAADFKAYVTTDTAGSLTESFTSGTPATGTETDTANDTIVYVGIANGTESITANTTDYRLYAQMIGSISDAGSNVSSAESSSSQSADGASPLLLSTSPAAGAYHIPASNNFTMTFSEPIATASFSLSPSPALMYGSFSYSWDGTHEVVTVSPGGYALGQTVTHTITAPDTSANVLVGTTTYAIKPLNPSSSSGGGGGSGVGGTVGEGQTNTDGTRNALVPLLVIDSIKLAQPVGGEILNGGSVVNITWTSSGNVSDVMIYYSIDGGATYGLVKVGAGKNVPYSWKVPNLSTNKALVRITGRDSGGAAVASDVSGSTFSIVADTGLSLDNAPSATHVAMVTDMLSRTEAEAVLSDDVHVDALVKVADDGDPTTDYDSTVYYIGLDAKRHPFPSAQVYFTWYENFDSVVTIGTVTLSDIALGAPVLVRPGTMMVKIQSDPRTFAVEPGNYTIRWVPSETVATALYGSSWNKRVIDIEPTYFSRFTMGADMTAGLHSSGSVLQEEKDGTAYYFDGVERRPFASKEAIKANNFQDKYIITASSSSGWLEAKIGSVVMGFEDGLFSLQR